MLGKLLTALSGDKGMQVSRKLLFDKVVAFQGVVGGVGTSSIVYSTAVALRKKGLNVVVVDLNFINPMQESLFSIREESKKDLLDFVEELPHVITTTTERVDLITLKNRTVVDMLSILDDKVIIVNLIETLKNYYDIVLMDVPVKEPTNLAVHALVKANKVITVSDSSFRSLNFLKKHFEFLLQVGIHKSEFPIVLNKTVKDFALNYQNLVDTYGLKFLGAIPFSKDLFLQGVSGDFNFTDKMYMSIIDDLVEFLSKDIKEQEFIPFDMSLFKEGLTTTGKEEDLKPVLEFKDSIIETDVVDGEEVETR